MSNNEVTPKAYKHRDIVIAYMDGKQIQYKDSEGEWRNLSSFDGSCIWPQFKANYEYRIKPEIKKYRVAQMKTNTVSADTEAAVRALEQNSLFIRWLTDWIEYEV